MYECSQKYYSFYSPHPRKKPHWKQSKCPSTDEWINRMWYNVTLLNYNVTTRRNLKNMRLSEKQPGTKRLNIVSFHSYGVSRRGKTRDRKHISDGWG